MIATVLLHCQIMSITDRLQMFSTAYSKNGIQKHNWMIQFVAKKVPLLCAVERGSWSQAAETQLGYVSNLQTCGSLCFLPPPTGLVYPIFFPLSLYGPSDSSTDSYFWAVWAMLYALSTNIAAGTKASNGSGNHWPLRIAPVFHRFEIWVLELWVLQHSA